MTDEIVKQNSDQNDHRLKDRIPAGLGLLDVSVTLAFLLNVSTPTWYIGVLAAKSLIAALLIRRLSISNRTIVFLGAVLFGVLPGTMLNSYVGDGVSRLFGFCAQIFLTVVILGKTGLPLYLRASGFGIAGMAALYTAMCFGGMIPEHYGRFLYFGGSQPNLGAEIGAIGVLAAALSMNWRQLMPTTVVITISVILMQGRSAIMAIALIMVIRFVQFIISYGGRTPLLSTGIAAVLSVSAAVLVVASGRITNLLSDVFLLTDQYRGIGTGFVGRSERWAHAYELFTQHHVFGVGASYFESRGEFGPHNYFLYGLTTMGVLGFSVFVGVLSFLAYNIFRVDKKSAMLLIGIFPLLMFNDRMININPYPFLLYVVLIAFPLAATPRKLRAVRRTAGPRAYRTPLIKTTGLLVRERKAIA